MKSRGRVAGSSPGRRCAPRPRRTRCRPLQSAPCRPPSSPWRSHSPASNATSHLVVRCADGQLPRPCVGSGTRASRSSSTAPGADRSGADAAAGPPAPPPPCRRDQIDEPDVILISHVHMDHLHLPSLRLFGRTSRSWCRPAPGGCCADTASRRDEVVVGDHVAVGAVDVEAVPAVHPPPRPAQPRAGRRRRVRAARRVGAVYFPGDTDLFARWGSSVRSTWRSCRSGAGARRSVRATSTRRAAAASVLLQPRLVVPIHWGTYSPITGAGAPGLARPAGRAVRRGAGAAGARRPPAPRWSRRSDCSSRCRPTAAGRRDLRP